MSRSPGLPGRSATKAKAPTPRAPVPARPVHRETVQKYLAQFTPNHWTKIKASPKQGRFVHIPLDMVVRMRWAKADHGIMHAIAYLLRIRRHGKPTSFHVTVGDLALALGRSESAIDRDLKKMEQAGIVEIKRTTGKPMLLTCAGIHDDLSGWKMARTYAAAHLERLGRFRDATLPDVRRPARRQTLEEWRKELNDEMVRDAYQTVKEHEAKQRSNHKRSKEAHSK